MTVKKLKRKLSKLTRLDEDTVHSLMAFTRKALEQENKLNDFKHIKFYCDWCLHSKLDKNFNGFKLLEKITHVLNLTDQEELKKSFYPDLITALFDFNELKNQLVTFYNSFTLPTVLFHKYWKEFYGYLMEILCDAPIEFPDIRRNEIKNIYDKLEKLANKNGGLVCKSLKIEKKIISGDENSVHVVNFICRIELFKEYVTVEVPLTMGHLRLMDCLHK